MPADNRCFLLASCSEGKTITIGCVHASRTVTIPPGSLPKKVSRAQWMWNTLPQGGLRVLHSVFSIFHLLFLHGESDCMLRVRNTAACSVTCEPDSYSHKTFIPAVRDVVKGRVTQVSLWLIIRQTSWSRKWLEVTFYLPPCLLLHHAFNY